MPDWISRQWELQGLHPWWAAAAHLVAVLAASACILLLHRYERQLVSPNVGRGLLALRLGVLALVLLTFLQPVQSWTINENRAGRIVIGFDQSQSTQLPDPQASRAEKLHWARGLGMIGHESDDERLAAWQAAFDRSEEPVWATDEEEPDPDRRAQLAAARQDNLQGVFTELNELSRRDMARRLLVGTSSPLLSQLEKLAKIELFVFGGKTEAVDADQLESVLAAPSAGVQTESTDLAEALRSGPSQGGAGPILGIVLFTDGRHTAPASPLSAAAALGRLDTRIYPVLLGTTNRPKDLAIPTLDAPPTVYRGDKPLVKAMLQTSGFEGTELTVELQKIDGESSVSGQTKTITPTGPLTPVEFELPSDEVGRHTYVLSIPVQEGETHADNNSRSVTIAVVDDRAKVLLVEGEARWEFRYLETAFSRDERIDLKSVLFQQPYLGLLPETFFPRQLPADKASPFEDLDVVVLGDIAPWQLTDEHWNALEKFVSESGGTVVLSAGKQYLPAAFRTPILDRLSPMASIQRLNLQDAVAQVPPSQRGLRMQLTPDAESQAMFRFADDPDDNRQIWAGLPGPVWAWLGTAKPAATVWTAAFLPARADLADERQQALIAHHHYGFGQVVWIGFDATWRWRHRVGDKYHHQFWGQLVRWAASNKITAGNELVRFGTEKSEVEAGDDIVLRTRWSPQFLERFPKIMAQAEVVKVGDAKGEPFAVVDLTTKLEQPILREGKAVNLTAGEYRARLLVKEGDLGGKPVETTFTVRPPSTPELIDVTANRELLAQIAEASGGKLLLADELHQLPKLLRPEVVSDSVYRETPLWDHGLMLVMFFGLLTGEWFLRKWNGLP